MEATIIRDWQEFDRLAAEWNDVLFKSRASSIFLTWEWISAWREAISDGVTPYAVAVRDPNARLVGIAPLYLASMRFMKTLPYRMLRFMADVATGSEYPDWIVDENHEVEALEAITEALADDSSSWDTLWLPKVAGWTGAKERLLNPYAMKRFRYRSRLETFSCIRLPGTIEDYEATLSAKKRYELRRNQRRFQALGNVSFCVCNERTELPEFLDALFDLHHRRWQVHGQEGVFLRKPAERRFYSNFAPAALERGWLALFGLRYRGKLKAVQIGYEFDQVFYSLQAGFDPDFESGVGHYLRHSVVRHLIENGFKSIDHLGTYTEHKRRWGAETRDGHEIFLAARKLGTLPLFLHDVWPNGRFIDLSGQITD